MILATNTVAWIALLLAVPTALAVIVQGVHYWFRQRRATIMVFAVRSESSHGNTYLGLRNGGPATATVTRVDVLDLPDGVAVIMNDVGDDGVELLEREEHYMPMLLAMGTPFPLRVLVQWRDARRGEQSRVRKIAPPP